MGSVAEFSLGAFGVSQLNLGAFVRIGYLCGLPMRAQFGLALYARGGSGLLVRADSPLRSLCSRQQKCLSFVSQITDQFSDNMQPQ